MPGQAIADAIARSSRALVEQHNSHFGRRTEDVDWLPFVGQRNWVVVTKDKRIRTHPLERQALLNAGVRAFILVSGNLKGTEMAAIFAEAMPAMLKLIAEQPAPFIARIDQTAKVTLMHPPPPPRRVTRHGGEPSQK